MNNVCDVVRRVGNPFLDDFPELVTIDSRDCADYILLESVRNFYKIGEDQYTAYVSEVIESRTRAIQEPIKKNSLPFFQKNIKKNSKQGKKIAQLQSNVNLFAQLYVALQNRDGDMEEFFSHEVQSFPPSLSEYGDIRLPSSKSELLKCLKPNNCDDIHDVPRHFHCKVLDGFVIVHSLPAVEASTFDDYAVRVFIPHIEQQLRTCKRIDIVWDVYLEDSLRTPLENIEAKEFREK